MVVTRWNFGEYMFSRNPDRNGGDTYWIYEQKLSEVDVIGSNTTRLQLDGFKGARRTLRFTAITGDMMRTLQFYYMAGETIPYCRDHLYPQTDFFTCYILSFSSTPHPTIGGFPGSGEDTWDVEMTLLKM
jgi:hypothetical protein